MSATLALGPRQTNINRLLRVPTTATLPSSENDGPLPNPGDMQVFNFHKPSLVAGTYTITTSQTVSYQGRDLHHVEQTLDAPVGQQFDTVAPQFTIDPKEIHSMYPPQGHADQ
jgi:hypothetical protein